MRLNVNSLLSKIDEFRYIRECNNAAVIRINESKLKESCYKSKIHIDSYDLLRCDRNRNCGILYYYIRSDIS